MDYQIITKYKVGQNLYSIYKNQIEVARVEGIEFNCSHYDNEAPKININYKVHLSLQKLRTIITERNACETFFESATDLARFIKMQSDEIFERERQVQVHNIYHNNETESQED